MEHTVLRHTVLGTVFQLDGTPLHFSRRVRALLDTQFRDRWTERGGPVHMALCSQDLIPLDFFFFLEGRGL
jgi:hypothetical protein